VVRFQSARAPLTALDLSLRRWDALATASVPLTARNLVLLVDGESCKPLERWIVGKGLDVSCVFNTGRTGPLGRL
jgi:hypothetical protein